MVAAGHAAAVLPPPAAAAAATAGPCTAAAAAVVTSAQQPFSVHAHASAPVLALRFKTSMRSGDGTVAAPNPPAEALPLKCHKTVNIDRTSVLKKDLRTPAWSGPRGAPPVERPPWSGPRGAARVERPSRPSNPAFLATDSSVTMVLPATSCAVRTSSLPAARCTGVVEVVAAA